MPIGLCSEADAVFPINSCGARAVNEPGQFQVRNSQARSGHPESPDAKKGSPVLNDLTDLHCTYCTGCVMKSEKLIND